MSARETMVERMRAPMPIMRPHGEYETPKRAVRVREVPWALFDAAAEKQADINHGQTLARLRERGGLSACECVAILTANRWAKLEEDYAHRVLYSLICIWRRGARSGADIAAIEAEDPS